MSARKLLSLPAMLAALATAGCGAGGGAGSQPRSASQVPLTSGAKIVAQARECDRGANAFCAIEFVVTDPSYRTSEDLVKAEQALLRARGWSLANGDTGDEHAAESPGHKLRVTYATAYGDLKGIDLVWIHRAGTIAIALSRTMFSRDSAMSLMLQAGSS